MAFILNKDKISLFVSYAPGTGSTSLEQHIRTNEHIINRIGFYVEHYPFEAFGVNSIYSRHITYSQFLSQNGKECNFIATATRNPYNYYFSEYRRILTRWCKLLEDKNTWIYRDESKDTLHLTKAALVATDFNDWFKNILIQSQDKGYMAINENHMNMATHFIRSEIMGLSFDQIINDLYGVSLIDHIGNFPKCNVEPSNNAILAGIDASTFNISQNLFGDYLGRFDYSFEESALFLN